ncbi:hypothetical protein Poli38472_009375 [Pythium oligandrum]|uniref:N-acetyltransferase n=1 Tax=Pythium oligandrum TaxID=41045 RepID=A0A8K1CLM0_PYTOL|nr:hypothetical protein Poli38472_009375 [Pythium oligandrum]|eukprot:TMW65208.1 hypothetical protein Poli38472_009375 [Pythium oligandrum]
MDVNDVLMRRAKLTPIKRKRATSTPKKVTPASKTSTTMSIMRFSKPLDKLSRPSASAKAAASRPSSPRSSISNASFESPQATAPTTQAYIDLGQKDFGKHVTCRLCGLLYTAGQEEDELEHQRFCKKQKKGITMNKWKAERVHKTFTSCNGRVLEIRAGDPLLHIKKLLEVKELLDDALGFVEEDVFLSRGHFLFIIDKQVVGCTTVERIETAFHLSSSTGRLEEDSALGEPVPAVLGIAQIWVHPEYRRHKVASRMLDVVRDKYIYGIRITKSQMAFSQPTNNGRALAKAYLAPHPVLVYD